jgi:hypothetical protein
VRLELTFARLKPFVYLDTSLGLPSIKASLAEATRVASALPGVFMVGLSFMSSPP